MSSKTCRDEDIDAELQALENELTGEEQDGGVQDEDLNDGGIDDKDQPDGIANATEEFHDADSSLKQSSPQASNEKKDVPIESKDVESAPSAKVPKSAAEFDAPHDKESAEKQSIQKDLLTAPDASSPPKAVPAFKSKKRQLNLVTAKPQATEPKTEKAKGVQASEKGVHVPAKGEGPSQAAAAPDSVLIKAPEKKSEKPKSARAVKDKKEKGPPRGKNAFMFFAMHKRDGVKAENTELKLVEISKKLGEMWRDLSEEEKKPYQEQAATEKEQLKLALPVASAKSAEIQPKQQDVTKAKPDTQTKPKLARTAYNIFCTARRQLLKEQNPESTSTEITKLLATTWKGMNAEDRKPFIQEHEEDEAKLKADSLANPAATAVSTAPEATNSNQIATSDMQTPSKTAATCTPNANADAVEKLKPPPSKPAARARPQTGDDGDREDEQTRMNVDWAANPAVCILAQTEHPTGAKLLVKRKGCHIEDYGLCDLAKAKRLRMEAAEGESSSPISLQMLEEWEKFQKSAKMAIFNNTEDGELDLDDLSEDSPLHACAYLGKLREPNYPLNKVTKRKHEQNDVAIKVPLLGLSLAVQRMIQSATAEKDMIISEMQGKLNQMRSELEIVSMSVDPHNKPAMSPIPATAIPEE